MKPDEYPVIKVKHAQTQDVMYGWLIGSSLVVVKVLNSWEIWNKQGVTVLRNIYEKVDVFEIAELMNTTYNEYFILWDEYPNIDLFRITMWGVPDGLRLYETIEDLRLTPKITMEIFNQIFQQATGNRYYQDYMRKPV